MPILCDRHRTTVGAGLLAKAVNQATLMLDVTASSRASPLPQGLGSHALWPIHQISLAGNPNHRVRCDLAGIDDTEAMPLIEPTGAGIGRVVDQAQAVEPQLVGTVVSVGEELLAQALIAPAFMQRQARYIKRVGDFHRGIWRQDWIGDRSRLWIVTHHIAVHHSNDLPFCLRYHAVLIGKID